MADIRPEQHRVLDATTPAERADATLDLLAHDAEIATAGTASVMTADQYRRAYGPGRHDRPGPWPEPEGKPVSYVDQEPGHWPFVETD
jgi:hypothetical protein